MSILEQWKRHQGYQYVESNVPGRAWTLSRVSTIKCDDYEIWMHNLLYAGICPLLILTADGPTEMFALEYATPKGPYKNLGFAKLTSNVPSRRL